MESQKEPASYLLPTNQLHPIEYHVQLNVTDIHEEYRNERSNSMLEREMEEIDSDDFLDEISGCVKILYQIQAAEITTLKLHALDIRLIQAPVWHYCNVKEGASVTPGNKMSVSEKQGSELELTIKYNPNDEYFQFEFPQKISNETFSHGILTIHYVTSGITNEERTGIFKRKYASPGRGNRFGFYSQFEPCNARQAFPCVDQPSTKAYFKFTFVIPTFQMAVSNSFIETEKIIKVSPRPVGIAIESEEEPEKKTEELIEARSVEFLPTNFMSTYLIGFSIGEFHHLESIAEVNLYKDLQLCGKKKVPIRIYTPLGRSEEGRFALEVGVKTYLPNG